MLWVKIRKDGSSTRDNSIRLPQKVFASLDLRSNTEYNLHLGQLSISTSITSHKSKETMLVDKNVFDNLYLISDVELNIWRSGNDLYLGPVVGIFVNKYYFDSIKNGAPPESAINHVKAGVLERCLTYYFTVDNVDLQGHRVRGYVFSPRFRDWRRYWFALPHIIYDRGVNFAYQDKSLVRFIRDQLKNQTDLFFINSRDYLGKWDIYKKLSNNDIIKDLLPETIRYNSFNDLESMLKKHSIVYFKSYYGSRGKEVLSIERLDNYYRVIGVVNYLKEFIFANEKQLKDFIESYEDDRKFIVQQGIDLLKYQGRKLDMRILIEKNQHGVWEAIYNQVRVAPKHFTITNSSLGGDLINYQDLIKKLAEDNIPTDKDLRETTITVAQQIESVYGSFGELGMDMAVDSKGKIWFIEANTKPDKDPEPGLEDMSITPPQCTYIFKYAKYLVTKDNKFCYTIKPVSLKPLRREYTRVKLVTVPLEIYNQLQNCTNAILKIGLFKENVICLPNFTNDVVELSEDLFNHFDFLSHSRCLIKVHDNQVILGPVVGVFASNGSINKALDQAPMFRSLELARANSFANTILYFFSIKDLNLIENKVNGVYWDPSEKIWKRSPFPLPDVLYDRGGGTLKKQRIISGYIRSQLQSDEIKKFNPAHYFDKWDVYDKLNRFKDLAKFLPLTILYKKRADIEKIFEDTMSIYIKDTLGSNGKRIVKVTKKANNIFSYKYVQDELVEDNVEGLDGLETFIKEHFKSNVIILQRAISLIQLNERNVDMRATVQRNHMNQIEIVAYPVRVGSINSPVTSTKSGSEVYQFEKFFKEFLDYKPREIYKLKERVERFLLAFYRAIETCYGPFGEIGIDFAVDVHGDLWFIECNAKPGKDTISIAYSSEEGRQAYINPLLYCKYLTDFVESDDKS